VSPSCNIKSVLTPLSVCRICALQFSDLMSCCIMIVSLICGIGVVSMPIFPCLGCVFFLHST